MAATHPAQSALFGETPAVLIEGWRYEAGFLDTGEERELLRIVQALPLEEMRYKDYTARRRGISFGGHYDFDANRLRPSPDLPPQLVPLRDKVARWMKVAPEMLVHVLVAEYRPGTPLGWHRDVPEFEQVVGISLLGAGLMQFRPYPPARDPQGRPSPHIDLVVEPRSIYRMRGPARWRWQHRVTPVQSLRYSITLRTAAVQEP
ncbi:2OG-Fe(II) oxygenase superfamily protein [Variovorax sp. PBS-H4]|uniref:alpha-ketoglutarate-dependent dioxygenase AlkB n=1 Tax=Variovorax sp. PBS-H4 TaxID=434008 RepID=UPI0013183DE0|nr:alpha-ketoglutarate-dependent dioxygenase AlkB [Variovorax sp. PBS-H4]VTU19755.1 2OG-Fe(II) oxygenase superfamily protein [Variovorax sp. PBS-H4]